MNNFRFLSHYHKLKKKINREQIYLQWNRFLLLKKPQQVLVTGILLATFWIFFSLLLPRSDGMKELEVEQAKVLYIESIAENRTKQIKVHSRAEAENKVILRAPNRGVVFDIMASKGENVKKHQELAVISPLDYFQILSAAQNKVRVFEEAAGSEEVQSPALAQELTKAKQELERARNYAKNMTIRSPIGGRIESSKISLGDQVNSEQDLFLVVDPSRLKFILHLSDAEHYQLGEESQVVIVDNAANRYPGKVSFISRAANQKSLSFEGEVTFDNREGKIKEGSAVEVLLASKAIKTHKLPLSALVIAENGDIGVMIYDNGVAHFRGVELVDQDPEYLWVTGIGDSAKVIVMGQTALKNGSKVIAKLKE
jgi:multidrug efflux system membrane fusion protein